MTGKLRDDIEMTHRAIEIVVEPALNSQLGPKTCLGMNQARGMVGGERLCSHSHVK